MEPAAGLSVSWDQFHRDCRTLASRLSPLVPFTAMIAVTRGGLIPAAILARELTIRVVETISVASYHEEQRQDRIEILKEIGTRFCRGSGSGLLIVDDLVDTGETARVVRALLPKAHFAAVYAKPLGLPFVDTFVAEVPQETWIYFPWDLALSFQAPIRGG